LVFWFFGFLVFWFFGFLVFWFFGFLVLALFQLKRLSDSGKEKHAVIFIVILIATVIGAFVLAWMLSEPIPID
jgi:hypothetical protein